MSNSLTLHSCIKDSLKRSVLLRGTAIAFAGALLIVCADPQSGLVFFFLGLLLIALGLIPYRKLCQLENTPHKLVITEEGSLLFYCKGSLLLQVPLENLEQVIFKEGRHYGIKVQSKQSEKFFFPYFTEKAFQQFKTWV